MATNVTSPTKTLPLSDRSTNTFLSSPTTGDSKVNGDCGADTKSMDYHRQVLKEKLEEGKQAPGHYISPSDNIMSPCTKKLSNLKGKKFKSGKPQALFAKTLAKRSFDKMSSEKPGDDESAA